MSEKSSALTERKSIVSFLRAACNDQKSTVDPLCRAADDIERGRHMTCVECAGPLVDGDCPRAPGFAQGSVARAGVGEQWLVDILEKFRERCLESVNLISEGFYGEVAENDIRAIDVKAWLASTRKGG